MKLKTILHILLLTSFMPCLPFAAWASAIFECSTRAEQYAGRFVLEENGDLRLIGTKGRSPFECKLNLRDYDYQPDAESPNFTLRMTLGGCTSPAGSKYEDRALARRMSLVVSKGRVTDGKADVHWVGYLQPSECRITLYEKQSIIRNAEKFKKGLLR